jgi:arsenate reductase
MPINWAFSPSDRRPSDRVSIFLTIGNTVPAPPNKPRILFLCTGNSCRSQMAEGWLRHLAGDRVESLSAGAKPAGYVHPLAIQVMREAGLDISQQSSKSIHDFVPPKGQPPDVVISVCSSAERECPMFPGPVKRLHWPFDDPFQATGDEAHRMHEFRRVRDEIRSAIQQFVNELDVEDWSE